MLFCWGGGSNCMRCTDFAKTYNPPLQTKFLITPLRFSTNYTIALSRYTNNQNIQKSLVQKYSVSLIHNTMVEFQY
jgi:hypothetical protein